MTRPIAIFILAALLTVVGCSSAPAAPPAAPTTGVGTETTPPPGAATLPPVPDPGGGTGGIIDCDALAGAVTAAVGQELSETVAAGDADCTYSFLDSESEIPGLGGTVNVRLEDVGANSIDLIKSIWPEGGEDIAGLGEAAYWAEQVPGLYAFHGGNTWAVQMILFGDDDDQKGIATAVMQALLASV